MKIVIDARRLLQQDDPTWPYYMSSLIGGLQSVDTNNHYVLFFNYFRSRYRKILKNHTFNSNFSIRTLRVPHRIAEYVFEDVHCPIDIVVGKADLVHGPIYSLLNNIYGKSLVTIHDLIFIREPETVPPPWLTLAKKNTDYTIKKTDAIIAISQYVKNDIMEFYNISEDKIRVIYNGVGKEFYPRADGIAEIKRKYGIREGYFLYVGAIEPRKNLVTLIEAYSNLPQSVKREYTLVVVGAARYRSEEVFLKVKELHLEKKVIFTGRVDSVELPFFYSGADLFVFPSLMEGFGLPPLEAMACGTPVVASNQTSIPEIVGDASLLINPRNPDEILHAIETVMSDDNLKEKMRQAGLERARQFTWERTARETLAFYEEIT